MTCSGCKGPTGWNWRVAAEGRNHPKYVPSASGMKVGKTTWYKVCVKKTKDQAKWACAWNGDAVYLGD